MLLSAVQAKESHPWARARWCGADLRFKALSQTPAKAARPWIQGQCIA